MQNPMNAQIDYSRYVHLLWKWKWLVILPAVVFPLVGGFYAMQLQDQFKSTTLILVQPQKVPTQFVPTTVTAGIEERIQTISQQIFSRTRLEQIIQEFDLFADARATRTPEEIVNLTRSRIDLKVHRNDAFQLSFSDKDPRLAMLVTNKLASLFIEENLKVREQQAIGTGVFLADEIERYRGNIREREKEIFQFRKLHMDEMPEQLASNQSRLSQLQNQLQINSEGLNSAEMRRLQIQQQISEIERGVKEEAAPVGGFGGSGLSISELLMKQLSDSTSASPAVDGSRLEELQGQVAKAEETIAQLRNTYTDRHPEVVRAQETLTRLEAEVEKERSRIEEERKRLEDESEAEEARRTAAGPSGSGSHETTEGESPAANTSPRYPPVYRQLRSDLLRVEAEIARLGAQNDEIQQAIERYQARIGASPARQLELQHLSDDYDNLKAVLDGLINKKLQADLAENLERKQKGEQFQILDPANLPAKPFYPNRLRFLGAGLLGGLGVGVGLVVLLDLMNLGVKSRQELVEALQLPVLGVLSEIVTPDDLRRRRRWRAGLSGTVLVVLFLSAVVVHVQVKPLPEAFREFSSKVRATHWTAFRDKGQ